MPIFLASITRYDRGDNNTRSAIFGSKTEAVRFLNDEIRECIQFAYEHDFELPCPESAMRLVDDFQEKNELVPYHLLEPFLINKMEWEKLIY